MLLALLTPAPQSAEEAEFRAWLENCREILADRAPDEVAYLASLGGFEPHVVYPVLSLWKDAMAGTRFENRMAMQQFQWEAAVQDVQRLRDEKERVPEFDLRPLWKSVSEYQSG